MYGFVQASRLRERETTLEMTIHTHTHLKWYTKETAAAEGKHQSVEKRNKALGHVYVQKEEEEEVDAKN